MAIDLLNPPVSKVSMDMAGKTFLIYGTNRTGKTKQATRFEKPVYLAFESGLNGISGVPFFTMTEWSDFVDFNRQITTKNAEKRAQIKQMYQTIIIDEASIIGQLCTNYVCQKYGVDRIADGNKGYGLWKEYSEAFETQLRKLSLAGFTVVFIAHEGTRTYKDTNGEEYTKIYPAGDKRIIDPICNLVDFIIYLGVNGMDPETGKEIPSSAYLTNTNEYHAGSRFEYCPPMIKEFSAENLKAAVEEAVRMQEENTGIKAVTYAEQQAIAVPKKKEATYEELVEEIKAIAIRMNAEGRAADYTSIVETHLGKGNGVMNTTPDQKQILKMILMDLQEVVA